MLKMNPKYNEESCGKREWYLRRGRMLTSERPTIDPCILGSAIGDLFPEKL